MKIQEIYNKISVNYLFISPILSGVIILIYLFFTTKVIYFHFYYHNQLYYSHLLVSIGQSIILGYEFALINYFYSNIHQTFKKIKPLFQDKQYLIFSYFLNKKLRKSWLYYLTIVIVLVPFAISELHEFLEYLNGIKRPPYFYLSEYTTWSLLLDIFGDIVKYLVLFLMAVIIWIMIELIITINELRGKYSISINVFDIDETGELRSLRSFILLIVSSYFIIITLAIIADISPTAIISFYTSPSSIITVEIIILSLMLLVGVILFIITYQTIKNLIDKGIISEIKRINEKYMEIYGKIFETSSNEKNNDKEKELNELKIVLDILEREERKIKEIRHKTRDFKTIATFIITFLLPIITKLLPIITQSKK
jgi:hypothetical protein